MAGPSAVRRVCDLCGKIDTAPRHRIAFAPGDALAPTEAMVAGVLASGEDPKVIAAAVAELYDTSIRSAHMDCCKDNGCFDGTCNAVFEKAGSKVLQDDKLRTYLTSGAVDSVGRELTEARYAKWQAEKDQSDAAARDGSTLTEEN